MISVAAAVFAWLIAMWGINPALAVESRPKVEGWDAISITQEAKVSTGKKAILIANSAYKYFDPLLAPPHDVEAMASQLSQLGFETTILQNPTRAQIIQAITAANPKAGRGSVLTFYYSGHGAEVDGENSLLLVDYRAADGRNGDQIVPLRVILWLLASANFEKVFIAFDACRNMTPADNGERTQAAAAKSILPNGFHGLARAGSDFQALTLSRREYAVLFSTSHGENAVDATVDGLSPFTKAFLLALGRETSFMPAMLLTKRITEELTKKRQSPDIEIKWNSDVTYSRSSAETNSAIYKLNDRLTAAEMASSTLDLSKITTVQTGLYTDPRLLKAVEAAEWIMKQMGRESGPTQPSTEDEGGGGPQGFSLLNLKDADFRMCQNERYKPFFWYSDVLTLDYCYMEQLGYKSSESKRVFSEEGGAVYNTTRYLEATWNFDLDFSGSPEAIRASLRNADMALTVTSKTSEFEFRGLIGPNIEFIGLHDFKKDGVLDVYIVYSMLSYTQGRELIILDGRKIAKELKTIKQCASREAASTGTCKRLAKVRRQMRGSLFTYDIDKGYYGADILQIALYADWNIKDWSIDENGALHLTTYSATWPYERKQPNNFMMDKIVAYDPINGKLNLSLSGEKNGSLSVAPLESQIDYARTADGPGDLKPGQDQGATRHR